MFLVQSWFDPNLLLILIRYHLIPWQLRYLLYVTHPENSIFHVHLGTMAEKNPLTGCEPNFIDNYHISETTETFTQESSSDGRPLNLHDLEFDDYPSAERPLHHCFRSEKIQRAVEKFFTLLTKACSRRLSVMSEQGDLFSMSLDH